MGLYTSEHVDNALNGGDLTINGNGHQATAIDPSNFANQAKQEAFDPNMLEESAAAFLSGNEIVSGIASETNFVDNTPDDEFDWYGSLQGTEYENNLEYFTGAYNQDYLDALKLRYHREIKQREVLEAGGLSAMGWSFLAAVLSPTSYFPASMAMKSGKLGYSAFKSSRNVAGSAAVSVAAQEALLHQSQGLRTFEESLLATGMGTAFGAMIGAGMAKMANRSFKSNWSQIFDQATRQSEEFKVKYENSTPEERIALLDEAKDLAKQYRLFEVKAAAKLDADLRAKLEAEPEDMDLVKYYDEAQSIRRAHSAGAASDMPTIDELGIFGKVASAVGNKTRFLNPILRNMNNPSQHARLMASNLFENPIMMKMNDYRDSPTAVETKWKQWVDGRLAEALRKIGAVKGGIYDEMLKSGTQMSRRDFREKVGQALRKNDGIDPETGQPFPEFNEHVRKAAKVARDDIFEELRKELNKVGLQLDSKEAKTALSYFTRVYNIPEMLKKEGWFKDPNGPVAQWVRRALDHEITTRSNAKQKDIENIQSQIDHLKDEKLRRQSDLEFRETGEAGRLHKELYDVDSEIGRLEAELERLSGEAEAPAKVSDIAEQNINDLLKAFGTNMELGENFNSGFLRQMGLDRSQIDDFTDYLMKEGYLRERNGRMQVRKLSDDNEKLALRSPDDPQADHVDKAIYNKLVEDANRILPDEYKFETPETLGGNIGGKVNLDAKLVEVALDAPDIAIKLRHEALHALRDRFTPDEWKALTKASKEIEFKNEAAYREYGVKGDELEEERIANLIEHAYKGGDISALEPKALGVLEKIVAWIKALATTLKKPEYNKLQTILDDMESGAIGRRSKGGSKGDDLYSLKDGALKTDTPEFKKWFGDSKIVDDEGNPLVVYHGTISDIDKFRVPKGKKADRLFAQGISFTQRPEYANEIIHQRAFGASGFNENFDVLDYGGNIVPAYISMKNPYVTGDKLKLLDMGGGLKAAKELKKQGYDGVIFLNSHSGQEFFEEIIAFDPTQIKSINNRGTFDPNDSRILYSLKEDTPEGITSRIEELKAKREKILDDIDKIEGGQEIPLNATADDVRAMVEASQSSEKAKMPETLSKFLTRSGGLIDESGELKFLGLTSKTHPKLVVSNDALMKQGDMLGGTGGPSRGMSFYEATLKAWEEGFYTHRPSISELLDDLSEDINGNAFVRQAEAEELSAYYDRLAIEEELSMLGIDPKNKDFRYTGGQEQTDVVRAAYRALDKQADAKIKKLEAKKLKLEGELNQLPSKDDFDYNDEVAGIVKSIFNKITGKELDGPYKPFDNVIDFGFLKGRTFGIDDEIIKDILVDDVEMVMRRYVRNVAGQVEMKKRFGTMDLRPHFEQVQDDFEMLRQEVRTGKSLSAGKRNKKLKRLDKQEKQTIKDLEFARDKILGRYEHDVDGGKFARAVDASMSYQYIISLGGVLLTSLNDAWRIPMSQGIRQTFGRGFPALIRASKGAKISREASRKFAGIAEIIHNSRLHELSGLRDPFEQMSPAEVAMQKMTDRFSKLTGLPYWNQFWKEFAAVTTMDRMISNMVKGMDNISPSEARWMRSLNLGDLSTGANAWKKSGVIEEIEGVWTVNTDKMPEAARDIFFAAVKREVDTAVITPGFGDKPVFAHHPLGRMATQFRSFGFASHQRMKMRGLQDPAGRFWGAVSGMVLTGAFIYALKQLEAGREIDDNPATWIVEGLDRSGVFFMFFELNNMIEKLRGPGVYTLSGAQEPASRFASRNTLSGLVPLLGTLDSATSLGSQGLSLLNPATETDFTPGDVKNARRLTPYASLPPWRALVDNYVVPSLQEAVE